jgi:TatA/E family protein of Tat protein translocase
MGNSVHMVIPAHALAFMEGLGTPEMMLIFVVVLVLFGGNKLPEFARGLGKSMREFKKAASGVEEEFKRAMEDDERKKAAAAVAVTPAPALPAIEAPSNPDGLPPEALTPEQLAADTPAPSIESIPPPPLIPLGSLETSAKEPYAPPPVNAEPELTANASPAPPAPRAPRGVRRRDDYS